MSASPIRTRRWTRREYHRLIELGILHEDEPIELLGGQLVVSESKSSLHSTAVNTQDPIAADDESEPEPDVAVVSDRFVTTARSIRRMPRSSSRMP